MQTRRSVLVQALAVGTLVGLARPAAAGEPYVSELHGLAIGGADPVAYFTQGAPVAGSTAHGLIWHGATWLFASVENRFLFEADPRRFSPRFGGYCAWAVGQGFLAQGDPEAWTIHRGRLYLTYSKAVRTRFRNDIERNIAMAEANWPAVLG